MHVIRKRWLSIKGVLDTVPPWREGRTWPQGWKEGAGKEEKQPERALRSTDTSAGPHIPDHHFPCPLKSLPSHFKPVSVKIMVTLQGFPDPELDHWVNLKNGNAKKQARPPKEAMVTATQSIRAGKQPQRLAVGLAVGLALATRE